MLKRQKIITDDELTMIGCFKLYRKKKKDCCRGFFVAFLLQIGLTNGVMKQFLKSVKYKVSGFSIDKRDEGVE